MTMITLNPETVEALETQLEDMDLERAANYRLSDAIREGSSVTEQAVGWGSHDTLCALSAATLAMKARRLLD